MSYFFTYPNHYYSVDESPYYESPYWNERYSNNYQMPQYNSQGITGQGQESIPPYFSTENPLEQNTVYNNSSYTSVDSRLTASAQEFMPQINNSWSSDQKTGAIRKSNVEKLRSRENTRKFNSSNSKYENRKKTYNNSNGSEVFHDFGHSRRLEQGESSKSSDINRGIENLSVNEKWFSKKGNEAKSFRKPFSDGADNNQGKEKFKEEHLRNYPNGNINSQTFYGNKKKNYRYSENPHSNEFTRNKVDYKNNKFDRTGKNDFFSRNRNDNVHQGNWRQHNSGSNSRFDKKTQKNSEQRHKKRVSAASQRERLVDMIQNRTLECMVCCEKIKHNDRVWSCRQCYHIIHLHCTVAWAKSSKLDMGGWRCPACQNTYEEIPRNYQCFCGKLVDPKPEPGVAPHSCGDMCMRKGRNCIHKCQLLCHPGPCPDCNVMVSKRCGCGTTEQMVKCSSGVDIVCESDCNKLLSCTLHYCKSKCHPGACEPCSESIKQECYCGKVGRRVLCTAEYKGETHYKCDDICDKLLSCGNHKCPKLCHSGSCDICEKDVSIIKNCPCGKVKLETERKSCLDPIPSCGQVCGKMLNCGQPSMPHSCKSLCHEGDCPPCELTTTVRCRCGHMDKEIPCQHLTTKADDARCEKKCTKKRLCGKHRCNQFCCIEVEHVCPLPCNRQLTCGKHRCDRTCHSGRCPPCMEASFEELYCECGASVLYPPVACGTKPPPCDNPCPRPRPCGHESNHNCHSGPCPPCTVLCKRWCYGKHEERGAIPCYQEDFSCGMPCGRPMSCGRHKCVKPCHLDGCPTPCKQPCMVTRQLCGHPCGAPCHDTPCPETICRRVVPVTCQCGLEKATRPCAELVEEYRNIEMAMLKDKIDKDQPVDISDVGRVKKPAVLKILECTEQCRVTERNRRLAIGLQIRNPDLSQKLVPKYSDYMRSWAKKDPHFCQKVHDKLTELVQLAKQSKQKSRSYSFESMNRDKRHFVHEYSEHFGCETAAYDAEPNRNVVATAFKDKSWLPGLSLLEFMQRENGQRKVPGPVISKSVLAKSESVTLKLPGRNIQRPSTPPGEYVDYFDDPFL